MIRRKKKKVDRLSNLPDPLIVHTLSLLDDTKQAAKTSILSKRWINLWKEVDRIAFHVDEEAFENGFLSTRWNTDTPWSQVDTLSFSLDDFGGPYNPKLQRKFISFICHTLNQCTRPNIKKFQIKGRIYLVEPFNELMGLVLEKGVEILDLASDSVEFWHDSLCHNSSIVSLKMDNMVLNFKTAVHFISLTRLSMCFMCLSEKDIETVMLGCPVLEDIVLDKLWGFEELNISSRSVKNLKLYNFGYPRMEPDGHALKVCAPFVEELHLLGKFNGVQCELVDVSSLKTAILSFKYLHSDFEFKAVWSNIVDNVLKPACHVDELVIGSQLIQALSLSKLSDAPSQIFKCKRLTLQTPMSMYELPGIVSILESTPDLETFFVNVSPWKDHKASSKLSAYHDEVTSFKEGLDLRRGVIPNLKRMKIDYFLDCHCQFHNKPVYANCLDFETVVYTLRSADVLEKLSLSSTKLESFQCKANCASVYASRLGFKLLKTSVVDIKDSTCQLTGNQSSFEFVIPK